MTDLDRANQRAASAEKQMESLSHTSPSTYLSDKVRRGIVCRCVCGWVWVRV